jgi:hypothetical protein
MHCQQLVVAASMSAGYDSVLNSCSRRPSMTPEPSALGVPVNNSAQLLPRQPLDWPGLSE